MVGWSHLRRSPLVAFCISTGLSRQSRLFSSIDDETILNETRDWFERIVLGLNLCPFADRPHRQGQVTMSVIRGCEEDEILSSVLGECIARLETPGTSLIVAPECHPDNFSEYLFYCTTLETELLPEYELDQHIQIAPFHPLFQFADSQDEGVDAWTNRSPHPTFHVLREEDVSIAVDKLDGDASKVWQRNIKLLQDLSLELGGKEELERVVRSPNHGRDDVIRNVLEKHRFQLSQS
jgi:hypothetical protein